jgi:hypothetical protein
MQRVRGDHRRPLIMTAGMPGSGRRSGAIDFRDHESKSLNTPGERAAPDKTRKDKLTDEPFARRFADCSGSVPAIHVSAFHV